MLQVFIAVVYKNSTGYGYILSTLRDHSEKTWRRLGEHLLHLRSAPMSRDGFSIFLGFQYFYVPKRIVSIKLDTDINRGLHDVFLVRDVKKVLLGAGQATAAFVSELHICSPWSGLAASDNGKKVISTSLKGGGKHQTVNCSNAFDH